MMTATLCDVSLFLLYFPAVNIEFLLYISRDLFSRDLVSFFFASIFYVTLKLFSLFHF